MVPVGLSIDLGTSHTVAMLRRPDGETSPLLFDGSPLLVSAVFADADGTLSVGRDALYSARLAPERFEPHPKRRIDDGSVLLGDAEVTVESMFAAILTRVIDECVRVTGSAPAVTLTHPATWGPVRRQILLDAADTAEIARPRLIPEPVAAADFFTRRQATDIPTGATIVVYDLGGGTFDVTVVRSNDSGFEILAADGASDLGGVDIDHAIVTHLGRPFAGDPQWARLMDPQSPEERRQRRLFLDDVRSAKERLSRHNHVDILIPMVEKQVHLTRIELEKLARPHLNKTVRLTKTLIRATGHDLTDVAGFFLVGGASRMPLAATLLHQATGIPPTAIDQPETVVACGGLPGDQGSTTGPPPQGTRDDSPPSSDDPVRDNERGVEAERRGDLDEAEIWYLRAAVAGEVVAMRNLGFLLRDRDDLAGAEEWFRRAAEAGHPLAMNSLGLLLNDRGDEAEAETWYRQAAEAGETLAMNNLGSLLEHQHGDTAGAESWYRKAAEASQPIAMRNLGCLLRNRDDLDGAEEWFRQAADGGYSPAMNDLGILLENRGDLDQAVQWYRRAGEAGEITAMRNLGKLLDEQGEPEAEAWLRRAVETGDPSAMNDLSVLLKNRGDLVEAETWFRGAVGHGNNHAMHNLGLLMEDRGDLSEAEGWFRRAADAGNVTAMNLLATILMDRDDFAEAETRLRCSADAGSLSAMVLLGMLPLRQMGLENLDASNLDSIISVDRVLADVEPWLARGMEHADNLTQPEHDIALWGLTLCHVVPALRGESTEAEFWLRRLCETNESFGMTYLGILLNHRGELAEAESLWRRAAGLDDDGAMARLGDLLENRGRRDEAETWYHRASNLENDDAMSALADLWKQRGDLAQAEFWWRRAADLDNVAAMAELGGLEKSRGEVAKAEDRYRKAITVATPELDAIPASWLVNESVVKDWYREGVALCVAAMTGLADLLDDRGDRAEADGWRGRAAEYGAKV